MKLPPTWVTVALSCLSCAATAAAGDTSFSGGWDKDGRLELTCDGQPLIAEPQPLTLYQLRWATDDVPKEMRAYPWQHQAEVEGRRKRIKITYPWGRVQALLAADDSSCTMSCRFENKTKYAIAELSFNLTSTVAFPALPAGAHWQHGWPLFAGDEGPAVVVADFAEHALVLAIPTTTPQATIGYDGQRKTVLKLQDLARGERRDVTVTWHFSRGTAAGGDPLQSVASTLQDYAEKHPYTAPPWPDRRPIAALHPSSSDRGLVAAGNPRNPRGWIVGDDLDVTSEAGRAAFGEAMMAFAKRSTAICQAMNAQGMICWSVEGQRFPHAISYLGAPDRIAEEAPEMDAIADAWFRTFSDAGLRTGVCIRPQRLAVPPDNPDRREQVNLVLGPEQPDDKAIFRELERKLSYANQRWGCTIFYVDSNVVSEWAVDEASGKPKQLWQKLIDWRLFAALGKRHPDCLIIPEHESFMYWSGAVPLGVTPEMVRRTWPQAFSVNLMQNVNDDKPETIARYVPLVRNGDVLLFAGWYDAALNRLVRAAYQQGHVPKWHDLAAAR